MKNRSHAGLEGNVLVVHHLHCVPSAAQLFEKENKTITTVSHYVLIDIK